MSEFQALLDDLEVLRKAKSPAQDDDEAIRASADGDADDDGTKDADDVDEDYADTDEDDDDDDKDDADEPMGKSFRVTLADGTEVDAEDGTALIKALSGDVAKLREESLGVLQAQADLIKSFRGEIDTLRADLAKLAKAPAGRKSVLNVHEKHVAGTEDLAKAERPEPAALMSKALSALQRGDLNAAQVAEAEVYIQRGLAMPPHLLRVLNS